MRSGQRRREKIQNLENRVNSITTPLPQVESMQSTPPVSQPLAFESLGMSAPAQSDSLPALEAFVNQNNLISNESNITNSSNAVYSTGPMTDLLNFGTCHLYLMLDKTLTVLALDMVSFCASADLSSELQSLESSQFTFPDEGTLDVPSLQVMKAGLYIAEMLDCAESLWDFSALRVFDKSSIPTPFLPPNLEPTEVQRRIPHHPLLDLFPWPSVRTKLIIVFSQPVQFRPPIARDPLALMHMYYDIDDSAEGLRISGSDWHSAENWEVGQTLFKNWWWAFDRSVVDSSNALRAKRGAQKLMLGPP